MKKFKVLKTNDLRNKPEDDYIINNREIRTYNTFTFVLVTSIDYNNKNWRNLDLICTNYLFKRKILVMGDHMGIL